MKKLRCSRCREWVEGDETFCPSCGDRLHRGCSTTTFAIVLNALLGVTGTCAVQGIIDSTRGNDYAGIAVAFGSAESLILLVPIIWIIVVLKRRKQ